MERESIPCSLWLTSWEAGGGVAGGQGEGRERLDRYSGTRGDHHTLVTEGYYHLTADWHYEVQSC